METSRILVHTAVFDDLDAIVEYCGIDYIRLRLSLAIPAA
jgi:hypothetical protein